MTGKPIAEAEERGEGREGEHKSLPLDITLCRISRGMVRISWIMDTALPFT